jgi:hypothetical protein
MSSKCSVSIRSIHNAWSFIVRGWEFPDVERGADGVGETRPPTKHGTPNFEEWQERETPEIGGPLGSMSVLRYLFCGEDAAKNWRCV